MADIPLGGPYHGTHAGRGTTTGEIEGADTVRTLGTVVNWAGAAVSLALILGISIWGYKMLARDVSGVPIVRAAEGQQMRVQPENPGGRPALHQGLAVNSVAALGPAEEPADRLILAPAPVDLSEEDVAQSALRSTGDDVSDAEAARPETGSPADGPEMASIRALADQLAAGAERLDAGEASETVQQVAVVVPEIEDVPEPENRPVIEGGLKQSLRPVLRPDEIKPTAVAAVAPAAAPEEIDPDSIAKGTRLAQLGAYESAEVARREWDRLSQRFGDYLEGKQRVIQRAQSGGRTFYRLRAMGFADLNDARRFCSALVAERADCIPVTTR
ncbi:SPOR domain-containing protein [Aquicoccus porphyridii]|uniref:SPOR domain-containing protein n=1 Tax=Aquicoccus porphyridii TaxID=1852029 RepID=UPI00273D6EE8|nr:SPOR domain-containing protein [Aquicoccus porphyridii]